MNPVPILRNERGVALPMALIVLVALTTLMLAFAVLVQTEPVVAHNQLRGAQARTHAEAGFERAVWALSQGVINPGTARQPAGRSCPFPPQPPTTEASSSRMATPEAIWSTSRPPTR